MWKTKFSMSCRFKISVALVAALALTAVMASAASAQFTSSKEHTILSGSQKTGTNAVFTAGEGFGGISCSTVSASGTLTGKSESSAVIAPEGKTCKDSFGRTVDADKNELKLTFTTGAGKGTLHVSGGVTATVTSGGSVACTVVINSPQSNNGSSYTNLGGTKGIEATVHATNVVSTTSGGFFNCGVSNGEHKTGTYEGTFVVTGKDTSEVAAEISVD
jgi:hypothetical protein